MKLNWKGSLTHSIDEGCIEGYITKPKQEEQLENYLKKHGYDEYVSFIKEKYENLAILTNLYIEENHRGNGFGSFLVHDFIYKAKRNGADAILLVADTGESNDFDLVEWYENYGFEIVAGEIDHYPLMTLTC